jgi:TonB family protein
MKRDFSISFGFHIFIFLAILVLSHALRMSSPKAYPEVYQVSLISLPQVSGSEGTEMDSAPVPESKPVIEDKPSKNHSDTRADDKTRDKSQKTAKGPVVPNLPPGMRVLGAEGISPEGSYYLGMILAKISQYWRNPYQGEKQEIRARIYFKIDKTGKLLEANIEKSSDEAIFDQAGLRAVYQAKSFPPFPRELKTEILGVHFEFEYVK